MDSPTTSKDWLSALPAELRNHIYDMVIPSTHYYVLHGATPPISRASRKLREENLPIWLNRNKFTFNSTQINALRGPNALFLGSPAKATLQHVPKLAVLYRCTNNQSLARRELGAWHKAILVSIEQNEYAVTTTQVMVGCNEVVFSPSSSRAAFKEEKARKKLVELLADLEKLLDRKLTERQGLTYTNRE